MRGRLQRPLSGLKYNNKTEKLTLRDLPYATCLRHLYPPMADQSRLTRTLGGAGSPHIKRKRAFARSRPLRI
jgi:hypothetical protein